MLLRAHMMYFAVGNLFMMHALHCMQKCMQMKSLSIYGLLRWVLTTLDAKNEIYVQKYPINNVATTIIFRQHQMVAGHHLLENSNIVHLSDGFR